MCGDPAVAVEASLEATGEETKPRAKPKGTNSDATLPEVQVTATRLPESSFDVSTAVTVVDAEEMRDQAPLTVSDYLRGQTGTYVQATTPGQAIPIVRGLKGSEVLHVVDGFRLNNAIFRNSPNQYFALVDAQNVERVEVARGPASTLYGSDAMGGVVQILTPEQRFDQDQWEGRGHFRAQYGSGDSSKVGRLSGAAGRNGVSFAGGVTAQDVGLRRLGGGDTLPFTDFESRAADAKVIWAVNDANELTLSGQYLRQPSTPRVDELVAGFGQTRPNSSEFYFEPNDRLFLQARYRITEPMSWFDHAAFQAGYQEINDDRRTREFNSNNRELEQNSDRLRGGGASFDKRIGNHELVWGAEVYFDTVNSSRERMNIVDGTVSARPSRFPDGSTMDSIGVYLNDGIELGERWRADLGARYDWHEIELAPNAQGVGAKLSPDDVSGHLGITFRASETVHIVSNLGRGFRAPNIFDLGVFGDRPSNRFAIPNSDLQPETVLSWDGGVKIDRDDLRAEAFVWRSWYKDKITSVDTGEVTESGRLVVQNRNVTELELWGTEFGAHWQFGERSQLYGALNFTRGTEEYAGDRYDADRVPPVNGRVGVKHALRDDLRLDAYAGYADRQDRLSPRDLIDPRVNPEGTGGWTTLNLGLIWEFRPDAMLVLRLENLADKRYREHGSGADEVGRSANVILDWRF